MAKLMSAVRAELATDFALMQAVQSGYDGARAGGFAGTAPGCLSAWCGTKYADVLVRAERWDARPPQQPGWEDADELPLEIVAGAGPLLLGGFDQSEVGLDVEGLSRARVLVFARGRQRYRYEEFPEGLPPEEWLLQVYPDPDALDALAGDPRRLSGRAPFGPVPATGWFAATHAWSQTGWSHHLSGVPGFSGVRTALLSTDRPLSRLELATRAVAIHLGQTYDLGTPHTDPLSQPLRSADRREDERSLEGERTAAQLLATHAGPAGLQEITVMGHLIAALEGVGLLLVMHRDGHELLVPNPCPGMVWDVLDIPEEVRTDIRVQIGYADFRHVADDLDNVVDWADGLALSTTPRTLATRLAVTVEEIRGALDLLALTDRVTHVLSAPDDGRDAADAPIVMRRAVAAETEIENPTQPQDELENE